MCSLSIFTATYNRAYILPALYESLCNQIEQDFEWIIIDDGSTDNTIELVNQWISSPKGKFTIRFEQQSHGGKQRAINRAVSLSNSDFFFIVDSDDQLVSEAVKWINEVAPSIIENDSLAGFSGIKSHFDGEYLEGNPLIDGEYIECNNISRAKYNLSADMAEVYKTSVLKKYPFPVWHNETFTPENVVFDRIALDGYSLRWYNQKIYLCEYREDGMVRNWNKLFWNNLIGFAMDRNIRAHYALNMRDKNRQLRDVIVFCLLKGDIRYLFECDFVLLVILLFPLGFLDYVRFKK